MAQQAVATLAGGCFWCLEAAFAELEGIEDIVPGYIGGALAHPDYKNVCTGTTGHAEAVQIIHNPDVIGFVDLLDVFFAIHDPTTLNRQGHDIGPQYRSVVFCHDPMQREAAESIIRRLDESGLFDAPIVTSVEMAGIFWPAEDYHHNYYARHSGQPYCQAVITPKLLKLRQKFSHRLKMRG